MLNKNNANASIIIPTLISSANLNSFSEPEQLTNNSGLSSSVNNGDILTTAQAVTHLFNDSMAESWVTKDYFPNYFAVNPAPVFIWDLGQDYSLQELLLWQHQNNGGNGTSIGNNARLFDLRYSTNVEGAKFSGSPAFSGTLQSVTGLGGTNSVQIFALGGVVARYIELTITANYSQQPGITGGGDRVGLGKIRFNVKSVDVLEQNKNSVLFLAVMVGISVLIILSVL